MRNLGSLLRFKKMKNEYHKLELDVFRGQKVIFWGWCFMAYKSYVNLTAHDSPAELDYLMIDNDLLSGKEFTAMGHTHEDWWFISANPDTLSENLRIKFEDYIMIILPNFRYKYEFYEIFHDFIEI